MGVWSTNSKGGHIGFKRGKMRPHPLNETVVVVSRSLAGSNGWMDRRKE